MSEAKAGRLAGKVALVFGAGSSAPGWGNGKATAVAYAREGARVVAVDKVAEAAEETAALIAAEGVAALAVTADVTKGPEIAAAVERTLAAHGRIDILHNNVGITEPGGPVETSEESWRRVLDTDLTGVFLTCKHVLPVMVAQRSGAIVNISSIAAIRWAYPYIGYAAAKAGVNQFTVAVARQHARDGVRANAILPGLIDTPMARSQIAAHYKDAEEMRRARDALCPLGFQGTAWDIAAASVFLASDEARYITGVCLPVDGGLSLGIG
ncbi:SDR family NAD(P)-dependent oxidoreductase [Azospirillum argentinense]|uniref:3-oxoacyl-ACP reductase n=1 Tax=Azospirillum argentinense TaxID=2970906 RepID=A0A2K1G4Z1_9PROT|nr:SDR family NAD(P)-dependent oxidoreductase [Azospirillum argentinense]PNQ99858.1 3-oxoacyl-ACP reductase [Azospirillum argentinense]